jgi:lysyl endopeptidase
MKRVFIALTALASYNVSIAQISKGGIPISFSQHNITRATSTMYKSPTYDEYEKVLNETLKANPFGAYNLGINFPMDIKFPESGTFHYAANGDVIWTAKITIAGAPATTFIYNDFMLPKGVKMYLYNSNRKQVLGAYTQENNSPDDRQFATEPVIGETVTIELNIDNNVNINDIALNINKGLVYYTGYEHLNYYLVNDDASKPTDPDQLGLEGRSSHCMINAKCPQAAGYEEARKASLQTIYTVGNGGACTGTMINSAGNTASNCKQYLLTASHCEETGSMTNSSHFSTMLLRYNFEKTECNSSHLHR